MKKKYYGIIFGAAYALLFRVLVEINLLDINSWTFMVVIPIIISYIPFLLDRETFITSKLKTALFPIASVLLFLVVAFITNLEDLGCFLILLPPYFVISIALSFVFRAILRRDLNKNSNKVKNSLLLLAIPLLLGSIEKQLEKRETNFEISQKIIINTPKEIIYNNLFSVPDLTNYIDESTYNLFGFPNPIRSEYDSTTNIRLGYFSNGIVLHESIFEEIPFEKLTFKINVDKSLLESSQTFQHILENENLVFKSISYELQDIDSNSSELTLSCKYTIKSNIPYYGEFWSRNIIRDFEKKLLNGLKSKIEADFESHLNPPE